MKAGIKLFGKVLGALVVLLVLVGLLAPMLTADQYGQRLQANLGRALGRRVEDCVATADVGFDRVIHAGAIAQREPVPLARTAARAVVVPVGEQGRDHAVLHVEERHRVMDDNLRPRSERRLHHRRQLRGVEIERRRERIETSAQDFGGGDAIRDVEREVADGELRFDRGELAKRAEATHEHGVRFER